MHKPGLNIILLLTLFIQFSSLLAQTDDRIEKLLFKGDSLLYGQNYNDARLLYDEAGLLAEQVGNFYQQYRSTYKNGYSYLQEEEAFLALAHFTEVQLYFKPESKADSILLFLINREIELIEYSVIQPNYNIEEIESEYSSLQTVMNAWQKARATFLIGRILEVRLERYKALAYYQTLLSIPIDDKLLSEKAYYSVFLLAYRMGDNNVTIEMADKILQEDSLYISRAKVFELKALAYFKLQSYNKALEIFEGIIDTYHDKPEYEWLVQSSIIVSATSYSNSGRYIKADSLFRLVEESFTVSQALADNYVYLYLSWAMLFDEIGEPKKALNLLEKGEGIARDFEINSVQRLQFARKKAVVMRHLGYKKEAITYLDSVFNAITSEERLLWNNNGLARYAGFLRTRYYSERLLLEEKENNVEQLKKLCKDFKDVLNISLEVYEEMNSEESRYIQQRLVRYDYENLFLTANLIYQQTGEKEYLDSMLLYIEDAKAIQFKSNLQYSDEISNSNISSTILKQEKDSKLYVERIRFLLNSTEPNNLSPQVKQELRKELPYAQYRYDSIRSVINELKTSARKTREPASIKALQSVLNKEQALLNYFITEGRLFIFFISNLEVELKEVPLEGDIKELAYGFREMLDEPGSNTAQALISYKGAANRLYNFLIKPFEFNLKGKNIIIVPDYELGLFPFEALISDTAGSSYSNLSYLLYSNPISEVYTLQQLSSGRRSPFKIQNSFVGFAPDYSRYKEVQYEELPGAKKEVKQIDTYFKGDMYIGSSATKKNFLEQSSDFDIVHLALHTKIDDKNPRHSQLLFSEERSPLTLYEIYGMQFKAKLLILSGCNTGIGKLKHGEGVMSLARGFFYAGIENIVLTKWAIADKSGAQIMSYFYKSLKDGYKVDEALQQAKVNYLINSDPLKHHPYYWAGYASVGKTVEFKGGNLLLITIGGIFLLIVCVIWVYKKGGN